MPRATVVLKPERHWLKTLQDPNDPGYVDIRRMTYGEYLESQDLAFQIQVQAQNAATGQGDPEMGVKLSQAAITGFQMRLCVVGHNLTDDNDQPLNLQSEADVKRLDPNVGQEITKLIDAMHNVEKTYPNSEPPSTSESPAESGPAEEVASLPATPQPDTLQTTS